ncbi:hypothetical protein EVAR_6396_1 [Eumeta japonica]|uniref:Uncharacterized protein n=1 Tax=Eumeta variegata TaxID=151549 RepID=A0A4C1TCM4_EUMVA|nr:hypothetical protein EVAR_6396_1 [Eumeta japonica]
MVVFRQRQRQQGGRAGRAALVHRLRVRLLAQGLPQATHQREEAIYIYKYVNEEWGCSKPDCGDEVCHPSRLVPRRGETRTIEVRFGTLNV